MMRKFIGKIVRLFLSFHATIVLLLIYATLLAVATWVEKFWGASMAKNLIYYSPVIFILQVLLVVNFFSYAVKYKYVSKRRLGLIFTHISFIIVIMGSLITHFFDKEGLIYLREGETTDKMIVRNTDGKKTLMQLPFAIRLNDFILERYPGSNTPSSYESLVTITHKNEEYNISIYMNNVFDIAGYRLYQVSFSPDEQGSVLSVNNDIVGRNVTYSGYLLLLFGLLLLFVEQNSRFRQLYRCLKTIQTRCILLLLFFGGGISVKANEYNAWETINKYSVNELHAARFGMLPVQSVSGRIMPINTFSSEILRKFYKKDRIGKLNSDQFLLSFLLMPDVWSEVPFIAINNVKLASYYDLTMPHAAFVQLFDSLGRYKLQDELEKIYQKDPALRNRFEKDVLKLDEQVNVFHLIASHQLLRLFPLHDDSSHKWYAPGDDLSSFRGKDSLFVSRIFDWYLEEVVDATQTEKWKTADEVLDMISTYQQARATGVNIDRRKIDLEVSYNQMKIFSQCRVGYLLFGGLVFLCACASLFGMLIQRWIRWLLVGGVLIVFSLHMYGIGMRWYIGGYAPWSNSYETMIYASWVTVLAGLFFVRRNFLSFALAVLFGGIILFVSGLNWMDPQITTLVPVLKSPWLMFHVSVIVAAYGFFGLSCLVGFVNLLLMCIAPFIKRTVRIMEHICGLSIVNEMSLWVGLVLMIIGTFLGAVWANESWGRYWGWDPKETWAIVTILIYTLVTHIHLLGGDMNRWLLNLLSVLAFSSVLMTFFGVNYFFNGMHSYGQSYQSVNLSLYIFLFFILVVLLGLVARFLVKKL